jgi:tight adherence protein B
MGADPVAIVALAGSLAAGAAVWLLATDRRQRLNNQRIAGVVDYYRSNRGVAQLFRRAPGAVETASVLDELLARLSICQDRPDLYPIPWSVLLLITTLAAGAVETMGYLLVGSFAWLALPVTWFMLTRNVFRHFEARRNKLLYGQLPDVLSMIVRSVRVGSTVQDSLRVVSEEFEWPTVVEFKRLVDEIRVGATMPDALTRLAQRSGLIEYRFFAVALALQSQSGGSLSETLENLADIVRKRVALRARAIALAAEARLTMYVLAGLPFFATGALLLLQPDYLTVLVTTSAGKKLLFAGIVLLASGLTSMRVIIRKSIT